MARVLLVDDDFDLTEMLSMYLAREGFDVEIAHDGEQGALEAVSGAYSIVVLDIMMEGISGIEALRRIRTASQVPVLMLTARGENVDRIVGLEMGADDYVPKPCTPGELVARIRAILRRARAQECASKADDKTLMRQVGEISIWPGTRRAFRQDTQLDLTGAEFSLLEVLTRHAGELVSKEVMSQEAFGRPVGRFDRSIDVHISSIRQKLGARPDGQSWILNVRGRGYQLLKD